jgi:hypothetical protein
MKKLFFIGIILVLSVSSYPQYTREDGKDSTSARQPSPPRQRSPFWDHVSIGGGFGIQFGSITYVAVSPLFSYHVNQDLIVGVGPMYQYLNFNDGVNSYVNTLYGGRIQALYFLPGRLQNIFIQGEYEILNVPDDYSIFANVTRATIYIPMAGIGIRRPIGQRSYYTIAGLWDFSHSFLSPYVNPTIIAGVDFGI